MHETDRGPSGVSVEWELIRPGPTYNNNNNDTDNDEEDSLSAFAPFKGMGGREGGGGSD